MYYLSVMPAVPSSSAQARGVREVVPRLENGDRLGRAEFERRYTAMPWVKKAELIEGRVYLGSRVGIEGHGRPHSVVVGWLGYYASNTPGLELPANSGTVRL